MISLAPRPAIPSAGSAQNGCLCLGIFFPPSFGQLYGCVILGDALFNVLVFTVLLLTMGGCNEDKFLKEDPRDALYPENLLVDYNGFKSMITPLYGLMRAEYRRADAMGGSIALCLHSAWGADNVDVLGEHDEPEQHEPKQ